MDHFSFTRKHKRLVRGVIVVLAMFLALFLVVFFTPFSSRLLDQEIRNAWHNATGWEMRFDRVTYRLSRGRLELDGIQVQDPLTKEPLAKIDRMVLSWKWQWWHPLMPVQMQRLKIVQPAPLVVLLNESQQFEPAPQAAFYLELFKRLSERTPASTEQSMTLTEISVEDFALYLRRESATETHLLSGLQSINFSFRSLGDGKWNAKVNGLLWGGDDDSSSLYADIQTLDDKPGYKFVIEADSLDLHKQFKLPMSLQLLGEQLRFSGVVQPGAEGQSTQIQLLMRSPEISGSYGDEDSSKFKLSPTNIVLEAGCTAWPTSRTLIFDNLKMRSKDSRLTAHGQLQLNEAFDYELELTEAKLGEESLRWLQSSVSLPATLSKGEFRGTLALFGDRTGLRLPECQGSIQANAIWFESPYLNHAIGPMLGRVELTTETLRVSQFEFENGQSALRGSGQINRISTDPKQGPSIRANWTADIFLDEILQALSESGKELLGGWSAHGTILGNGSIRGNLPVLTSDPSKKKKSTENEISPTISQLESLLSALRFDGLFRLDEVDIDHPMLPAPITELFGGVVLANRTIECTNLEGKMLRSRIALSGQIKGTPFIWTDPQISMRLTGNLDLARVREIVSRENRPLINRLHPTGSIDLDLLMRGSLAELDKITFRGDVKTNNISLQLQPPIADAKLSALNAEINLLPERILINSLQANLDGIDLATSGTIRVDGCELSFSSAGDLKNYQQKFPWILRPVWNVDGPIRVEGIIKTRLKNSAALAVSGDPLSHLLAAAIKQSETQEIQINMEQINKRFDWDLRGSIEAQNCEFWHVVMPASIKNITGRFIFDGEKLYSEKPLRATWGMSEGTTSATLRLSDSGYIMADYALRFPELFIDEWIQPWRFAADYPKDILPVKAIYNKQDYDPGKVAEYKPRFFSQGMVYGDIAHYKDFQSKNLSGQVQYVRYFGTPSTLICDNIHGDLLDGTLDIKSRLIMLGKSFLWNFDLGLNKVLLNEFIEAYLGKPGTISGKISGNIFLQGQSRTPGSMLASGKFHLAESRFLGNPIFSALGGLLKSKELEDISFTNMDGEFSIQDRIINVERLNFDGTMLELEATGQASLNGELDLQVYYRFLSSLKKIPILKTIVGAMDYLGGKILKVKLSGNWQNPKVTPVVFSLDELKLIRFKKIEQQELPPLQLRPKSITDPAPVATPAPGSSMPSAQSPISTKPIQQKE